MRSTTPRPTDNRNSTQQLFTVRELADALGLGPRTIRDYVARGELSGRLIRAFRAGLGLQLSDRFPFPRHPRDPRAVSDPRLILDEFPDLVRAR